MAVAAAKRPAPSRVSLVVTAVFRVVASAPVGWIAVRLARGAPWVPVPPWNSPTRASRQLAVAPVGVLQGAARGDVGDALGIACALGEPRDLLVEAGRVGHAALERGHPGQHPQRETPPRVGGLGQYGQTAPGEVGRP